MKRDAIILIAVVVIAICFGGKYWLNEMNRVYISDPGREQRKQRIRERIERDIRGASIDRKITKDIEADILLNIVDSL